MVRQIKLQLRMLSDDNSAVIYMFGARDSHTGESILDLGNLSHLKAKLTAKSAKTSTMRKWTNR